MADRRQFLTAAAAFAAGAAVSTGTSAAASQRLVTLLSGRGKPSRSTGVVGDFFIDTHTHAIYGPKRSSGWGSATNLVGPRGVTGKAGAAGARGVTGATGSRGATGAPGTPGAAGIQGPRGYEVLHGAQPPAPSDGEDNDFYIDTATTQLYGPKTGGVWGSPVSLTGGANIVSIDGGGP